MRCIYRRNRDKIYHIVIHRGYTFLSLVALERKTLYRTIIASAILTYVCVLEKEREKFRGQHVSSCNAPFKPDEFSRRRDSLIGKGNVGCRMTQHRETIAHRLLRFVTPRVVEKRGKENKNLFILSSLRSSVLCIFAFCRQHFSPFMLIETTRYYFFFSLLFRN